MKILDLEDSTNAMLLLFQPPAAAAEVHDFRV